MSLQSVLKHVKKIERKYKSPNEIFNRLTRLRKNKQKSYKKYLFFTVKTCLKVKRLVCLFLVPQCFL